MPEAQKRIKGKLWESEVKFSKVRKTEVKFREDLIIIVNHSSPRLDLIIDDRWREDDSIQWMFNCRDAEEHPAVDICWLEFLNADSTPKVHHLFEAPVLGPWAHLVFEKKRPQCLNKEPTKTWGLNRNGLDVKLLLGVVNSYVHMFFFGFWSFFSSLRDVLRGRHSTSV